MHGPARGTPARSLHSPVPQREPRSHRGRSSQDSARRASRADRPPPPRAQAGPPLNDAARDLAIRRIARQAQRFPDLALTELDTGSLPPRDAAFAHAIYDAVIRRWLTLSHILDEQLSKPLDDLEPRVAAVLLAGAAQLLLLDRVPPHAAINHAVEWAKLVIRPGAAGLVNAVLRRVAQLRADDAPRRERWTDQRDEIPLPDGTALPLTAPVLPKDPTERLAVVSSTAWVILDGWSRTMPPEERQRVALHAIALPPIILNTAHAAAPLPSPPLLQPHAAPGHHVFTGTHAELTELLASRSDLWVQDPASSLAVASVADLRPRLIIDLCAGQGTKTRQLAATFPDARIVATDVDATRYRMLQSVFHGHPRVEVLPAAGIPDRFRAQADLILLDVPCSNTGVLARRPEAKYRFEPARQSSLTALQRQIIEQAAPLRADGPRRGVILYSTCSIEPAENEEQAAWAAQTLGVTPQRMRRTLPAGGPGEGPERYTDGSFSVLLT